MEKDKWREDIDSCAEGKFEFKLPNSPQTNILRQPMQKLHRSPHFTGRENELMSLLRDLQPCRVVTICGPGGMGKTALAAEAIWRLAPGNEPPRRFPHGIIVHTFYHKPQAALALEAIARAYGEDLRISSPLEAASRALSGRQALIVLDGTEACDDLETVLSVTASCGVLITTRHRSDAPADFSDLSPLPTEKAIELLQAWGGTLASDKKVCQSICDLLGGLPLAIFLVGRYMVHRSQFAKEYLAWLEKTPLDALDLGERQHQSIPLLMEHSLLKISDQAQDCLSLTGILALKPFEPEIIAVALEISAEEVNLRLGELVEFGLLIRPDVHYQITHALIHTYARATLAPPSKALARLAENYINFISNQTQLGPDGYALLDAQCDHILAVQAACKKASQWDFVRKLTQELDYYLNLQGHWTERIAMADAGLNAARAEGMKKDEGIFLNILGETYSSLGDTKNALKYLEIALEVSRETDDCQGEGTSLVNLGKAYKNLGNYSRAIEFYNQSLIIARQIDDKKGEGEALGNIGVAYYYLDDPQRAIRYHEEDLAIARQIDNKLGEGIALGKLGQCYAKLGETQKAIGYHEEDRKIALMIGNKRGVSCSLGNLGMAYAYLGEYKKAIEFYEEQLDIAREIQDRRGEGNALWNMSLAYENLSNRDRAIHYAKSALKIYEQMHSINIQKVQGQLAKWGTQKIG